MDVSEIGQLFNRIAAIKVAVVGDVMLDTYWWGNVERISPEAPVPVVALSRKEYRIGGAGNVALNLVSLGAKTTVFTVIGDDPDGDTLVDLLNTNNIITGYVVKSATRTTTNKTRVMSRNQQMMRLDSEVTHDINADEQDEMLQYFEHYITTEEPNVVILEDYNKGVLPGKVIERIIEICKRHNVITAVDPKRKNFFAYKGVTIFKPNLKEVFEGLNVVVDKINETSLNNIHLDLNEKLAHEISLITLSEKGIYFRQKELSGVYPSHVRSIADVSGAGDTVIAVASLVYAATNDIETSANIANIAGGLVCEEVGTAPIDKNKLMEECRLILQ
jgi:rfaE bifunctional protein kinase chain/domain